ncbi:MAG: hypothetical protein HOP21_09760 [Methylotenera sp.]|nr:hypothetical protein [Methylotenera sp.]
MKSNFVSLLFCIFVAGCANVNQMAIKNETKSIDVGAKSILLMPVNISRPVSSRYTPHPLAVKFEKVNASGEKESIMFQADSEVGKVESDLSNKFYMRMALEPGEYTLHTILGNANAFPFNGFFNVPLLLKVTVPQNSIIYLGKIDAILRPRKENEFRAGSVIPLIDQSVTGVSSGTFDISVIDSFDEDISEFKSKFPVLARKEIKKNILPTWEREKAQAWWQGNDKN